MSHHRKFPRREKEGKRKRVEAISSWQFADPQLRENHQPQSSDVSISYCWLKMRKMWVEGKSGAWSPRNSPAKQTGFLSTYLAAIGVRTAMSHCMKFNLINRGKPTDEWVILGGDAMVSNRKTPRKHLAGVWLIFFSIFEPRMTRWCKKRLLSGPNE